MERPRYLDNIKTSFKSHPIVALLGPRQVGKSTLSNLFSKAFKKQVHFFDLEDPTDLARLESAKLALQDLQGLIIIDEIQRRPELFPILRVLADKKKSQFLILGSASRDLIQQSSETLAGRISYIEVRPFSVVEKIDQRRLWNRGGFPRAYLLKSEKTSHEWVKNYVSTFLERDIPQLGFKIPSTTMRKFWMMLAHYHGNVMNAAEIGVALGISGQSVRRYLDILTQTFMIRELQPWHANIDKRQIKTPKIYFRDSGIFHFLIGLDKGSDINKHPKLGASWEGFALEQMTAHLKLSSDEIFFWGTHSDAELDLFFRYGGKNIGIEFKYTDAPKITKSMHIASKDLDLDKLFVIYPGNINFKLSEKITAIGLENIRKFSI